MRTIARLRALKSLSQIRLGKVYFGTTWPREPGAVDSVYFLTARIMDSGILFHQNDPVLWIILRRAHFMYRFVKQVCTYPALAVKNEAQPHLQQSHAIFHTADKTENCILWQTGCTPKLIGMLSLDKRCRLAKNDIHWHMVQTSQEWRLLTTDVHTSIE